MESGSLKEKVKDILSWSAWPGLMVLCILITQFGFMIGKPILFFNLAYLFLAVTLLFLERFMPHAAEWNDRDGQTIANIAHTLASKGTVQALLLFSASIGLAKLVTPMSEPVTHGLGEIWPRDWPLVIQVVMGVAVAEFGLYWAHRLAHEWMAIWRFHAVHHSVNKLWIVNTGRFHFVDSLISIVLGMTSLVIVGAPMEVLVWLSAITAFIGMLTHCNVDMRFGALSWWFNTPELHRWHHSRKIKEGNKNYGENVMLWDHIFRTWFNPQDRRSPVNIGINEYMPPRFVEQVMWPFRKV